ncbi:efflux RND transporter periplasmic adaptor subunit [Burkholderiaceae bacterium FT117]|uniref:efflux RND transporter periplasmic adaptor subunit n=1 Tax=Zeimonas sediminis TaxID=2944268 RepID=UPI002342BE90|nr:efflux RND transporter periplasmic adaptor subunit [Zeimonas sediminis]MCM5569613.1 efflux RND transporter periplasmic adaptor subunit [Zeimonas sediminis]
MNRTVYWALAAAGLAGLAWGGWSLQRGAPGPAFEAVAAAGTAQPASAQAGAAPAASAAPSSGQATSSAPARPPADPPPGGAARPAAGAGAGGRPGGGPVAVEAAEAVTVALSRNVSAVGTLRAAESVVIKPEIAGRIASIGFEGGARVRKGELLIALDAAIAAAEAEQTRAELGLAQANYQRTVDLAQKQFVSERARDEAAATLRVLEARLKLAQARLSKTEIRAPFGGVLGLRNVSVGDYVKEGAELVVLEDVSSMQVDLRLPERFVGELRRGQRVRVEFDAWPGRAFEAVLEAIDVQVDANGRSVVARGRLPNADGALRTGMFAKASLTLSENPRAVMVPEEAVVPSGAELFVYRVENGKALRTRVEIGQRREGRVEIVSGLAAGARVVTAGQLKLQRDGLPVRVVGSGGGGATDGAGRPGAAGN